MIKIVKHGERPDLKKNFRCDFCGCEFIADYKDYQRKIAEYNESCYKCCCPECGKPCFLYE